MSRKLLTPLNSPYSPLIPLYFPFYSVIKHLGSERAARAYVRNDGRWGYESHVNYDGTEWKSRRPKQKQTLAKKFFLLSTYFFFCQHIFHFSLAFRPSCSSTSVFGNIGFYWFWLYFRLFILKLFLKNELNSIENVNKNCLFPINFP